MSKYCKNCDTQNGNAARRCKHCNQPFGSATIESATVPPRDARHGEVKIFRGAEAAALVGGPTENRPWPFKLDEHPVKPNIPPSQEPPKESVVEAAPVVSDVAKLAAAFAASSSEEFVAGITSKDGLHMAWLGTNKAPVTLSAAEFAIVRRLVWIMGNPTHDKPKT